MTPDAQATEPRFDYELVRPRAQVLARADRELKAELVRLRRAAGLTQQQLADRMGVSQQAVHKLEHYDSDPKMSTLRRYANAVEAIVEHRVTRDVGQSMALAAPSRWDVVSAQSLSAPITLGSAPQFTQWAGEKRTSFALAS